MRQENSRCMRTEEPYEAGSMLSVERNIAAHISALRGQTLFERFFLHLLIKSPNSPMQRVVPCHPFSRRKEGAQLGSERTGIPEARLWTLHLLPSYVAELYTEVGVLRIPRSVCLDTLYPHVEYLNIRQYNDLNNKSCHPFTCEKNEARWAIYDLDLTEKIGGIAPTRLRRKTSTV